MVFIKKLVGVIVGDFIKYWFWIWECGRSFVLNVCFRIEFLDCCCCIYVVIVIYEFIGDDDWVMFVGLFVD